jgi:hypothetical protein
MVRGLSVFQAWFKDFGDHYVLIGGTAAKITMAEEGLALLAMTGFCRPSLELKRVFA